jgi:probable F420-dependent oxidoreductase
VTVPMRFGVSINASTDLDPAAEARHAEALGFDMVSVTDHLAGTRQTFETWTLLAWMAAATERIGLLTNVLGLPYRSPAVTAKMAESLDRLSGGRLVLGLGGGASNREFESFGLPVRSAGEKMAALEEGLQVIRGLWQGSEVTLEGEHYSLHEAEIAPRAERRIPIWLGTYGPRGLGLAARYGDGWIPSLPYAPPDRFRELRDVLRRKAEEAGRYPDELTYAYNMGVRVDERAQKRDRVISGSADEVVETLVGFARMGVTFFNFWPAGDAGEQRERLAKEIVPALADAAGP